MPPSSSVARGGAGVVPGDERAATWMIGEILREPAGLRRALTAATEVGRDGARHVVALAAVAVQHHRVPRTDLEAVIALERLSARPAEIGPERSCVRRVVLVVSDHGVGDRPEASPGRRVAVEVLVERPVRVDEVSERQHLRAACAVDQVPGSDEDGMILQRRRRRRRRGGDARRELAGRGGARRPQQDHERAGCGAHAAEASARLGRDNRHAAFYTATLSLRYPTGPRVQSPARPQSAAPPNPPTRRRAKAPTRYAPATCRVLAWLKGFNPGTICRP